MASRPGVAPELGDWIIDFAFGEVYARERLGLREREMVTLAILTTLGDTDAQLFVHIHGALNVGVTRSQIIEVLLHCVPYAGFPRVLNAIRTVKSAFENNAEETPQEASEHM